jgi:2-polyprenyl-3-methyl-5-hydroxy-6-metoxy-1,4-benzoquinol methylase
MVVAGPNCISCGHDVWSVGLTGLTDYLTDDTFSIHRCNQCNLLVTQPLPMGEEIGKYYPAQYRGNRHSFTGRMRSALRRRAVESCFGKDFRGRLLDIGCGDGSFAMEMKSHGWEVSATEIDPGTVARLGAAGINAKLSHDAQQNGFETRFDAITCWHVLEHVENPRQIAEWVRALLADGGVFQPTVPNVDCLQARLFGRKWVHLDVPRHRQHFTPATLRSLLETAGFQMTKQTKFALEYDWFGVIQSALNCACARQNVLFDKLTHAPIDASKPLPFTGVLISYALTPFIATASLPLITAAALAGDGATLTLTCRAK